MKESRLTVGKRLWLGFGAILLLAVAAGVAGYYGADRISENSIEEFRTLMRTDAAVLEHSTRARSNVLGLRRYEKDIFLNIDSKEKMAEYLAKWKDEREHLLSRLADIEKAATLDKDKDNVKLMRTNLAGYEQGFMTVFNNIQGGKIKAPQEGNAAINDHKAAIQTLEKAVKEFSSESSKKMAQTEDHIRALAAQAKFTAFILMALSVGLGIVICILVIRSITRPLANLIKGLDEGAQQVSTAAGQVSSASQQLAEGTSEQAASIEETSSALEQMASMTKRNAENADHTNQLMTEASQLVQDADRSMGQLIASIDQISRASEDTFKIIKTIDEIAFQTNLLALNAAVEAARAGEAGAGFAVVADEVRNLAMRAADAAKNTASLIETTIKEIKDGAVIVEKTNSEFCRVSTSVGKMSELVGDITAASREQALGIEEINRAVTEMDRVLQDNAGSAEESAAASEELNAQAEQMHLFVQELVNMVGGKGRENGMRQSAPAAGERVRAGASLSSSGKTRLPSNNGGRKANTPAAANAEAGKKEVRPEQVIPFDDDDFGGF